MSRLGVAEGAHHDSHLGVGARMISCAKCHAGLIVLGVLNSAAHSVKGSSCLPH
jgi:hypothetical protein